MKETAWIAALVAGMVGAASANEELRLNFVSTSFNWLDNVSATLTSPPVMEGDISIEVVSGGRVIVTNALSADAVYYRAYFDDR